MGILDDAIRQHLELKRAHGVAEEELRRQEEEALGPARRDVAPADAGDGDGELTAAQEAPEVEAETPAPEAPPEAAAPPEATVPTAPELHEQETALHEPGDPVETEFEEPAAADHPPAPTGDTPGHGFEVLDEDELLADDEDEPGDEEDPDVLVDTPDFLQETPEHDRLWFEQKPPRDFDFD